MKSQIINSQNPKYLFMIIIFFQKPVFLTSNVTPPCMIITSYIQTATSSRPFVSRQLGRVKAFDVSTLGQRKKSKVFFSTLASTRLPLLC